MTDSLSSCCVVLRTIRPLPLDGRGAGRMSHVRPVLHRLRHRLRRRGQQVCSPRALRRLPRGTWQVRLGRRWFPMEYISVHRGPGWLHIVGRTPTFCADASLAGRVVQATVWQHRVSADDWRRLGVAAGGNPK